MQLHPGPFTLPWHSNDNSDLQWGQLSRPYSSTDRSSSLGSMESLDTPTPTPQTYSDSHISPVDPTLFNNKRDSAYSSFSASSNTSDYATVPLRPGEACSMDNLLQGLGPSCQGYPVGDTSTLGSSSSEAPDDLQLIVLKSRSLTRPRSKNVEIKERPSSCCYEEERRGGDFEIIRNGEKAAERKMNPPQPPTRKDSFRATRSRPNAANKRCVSAPIDISSVPFYQEVKSSLNVESGIQNGFPAPEECGENFKEDTLNSHYIQKQTEDIRHIRCDISANKDYNTETTSETSSLVPMTSLCPSSLPAESSMEVQERSRITHSEIKHSPTGLHRHSAPAKLLATQLQLLDCDSDASSLEPRNPSDTSDPSLSSSSSQWSYSSLQPTREDQETSHNHPNGPSNKWGGSRCSTPGSVFLEDDEERLNGTTVEHHHPWGRSASVPGDPTGSSIKGQLSSDQILERDFQPLSAAASMDTLLEEQRAVDRGNIEESVVGEDMKRSPASRNHRRNRRRNERFATNLRNEIQRKKAQLQKSRGPGGLLCSGETVKEEEGPDLNEEGDDPVQERITKVAFARPVSPQIDAITTAPVEKASDVLQTQSTSYTQDNNLSRSVQILDPGVPHFGVGVRVVEEPAPAGKARRWRWTPEHKLQPEPESERRCRILDKDPLGLTGSRHGRRYSYQGGLLQESDLLSNSVEARRLSMSTSRERQKEKEREQAREREERAREREREERLRERERERKERDLEMERARLREIQREREREERVRQWERERERELELEREKDIERARDQERLTKEREEELKREKEREDAQLSSHQEFYGVKDTNQDFQHIFQPKPQTFSHSQTQNHVPRSAFHPVNTPSQPMESQQPLQQGYTARSYTPTEMYPARQQEAAKLNRKYSLTERDYSSSRPPEINSQLHQSQRSHRPSDGEDRNGFSFPPPSAPLSLRGRAMSENDLRFDSNNQRWKKTPPPPRPPPPKWEQFHRRRPSHQSLFSAPPQSIPPSLDPTHSSSSCIPPPPPPTDTSRQRSFSLPPQRQEVSENCPRCNCSQTQALSSNQNQAQTQEHAFSHAPSNQNQAQTQEHSFSHAPSNQNQAQTQDHTFSHAPSNQNQAQTQDHTFSRAPSNQNQAKTQEHSFSHAPSNQMPHQDRTFTVAPPSPMFSRRGFRPVAPPQAERDLMGVYSQQERGELLSSLPPPPLPPKESSKKRVSEMIISPEEDRVKPLKDHSNIRPGAEWERTPSPRVHSDSTLPPVMDNVGVVSPPESYLFHSIEPQKISLEPGNESETTLSPSPAHSLDAELDIPMETDIDDFQEEDVLLAEDEPITSELPCFALPVTVLETDIDTLEEESGGERLSLEELFPQNSEGESGRESWRGAYQSPEHNTDSLDRRSGASSSCSSYYSTSAAKAQLLSQMKDFTDTRERDEDDELTYKKQLMESLRKKLGVLREAQRGLQEDIRANAQLGEEVESMVVVVCKPNEVDKFRMFIGDLDKVVSLLLSLSGRLLRVESTLDTLDPDTEHHERLPLLEKKRQLLRQLSEAQDLKDHVDRREQAVSRMKAALLVEQRQLEDKTRLGEEQLRGLRESLGVGLGIGMGMSMGYGLY
ncbi:Protein Shroom4 [Dissostichus eleginoides]|uniref:Protein Shroom4 n=1 Tax=Dissostichus eleginoides TaxID=100907 RepID=A0AAD9BTR3_DISEL|nr:Protein Shroom4 [Dissostichus eleginoides]